MAKLRDIVRGIRAVHPVEFRRANAPAIQPGSAPPGDSAQVRLGVRVLTGAETADVYQKAQEDSAARGVVKWDSDHEICRLYLMAHTIAHACVDIDSPENAREPFFDSVQQILESDALGTDNLALLYELQVRWQDEVAGRNAAMTVNECVRLVLDDANRKPGEPGPLVLLPHAILVSCTRSLVSLAQSLLTARLFGGEGSESPTPSSKNETASEPKTPPPETTEP